MAAESKFSLTDWLTRVQVGLGSVQIYQSLQRADSAGCFCWLGKEDLAKVRSELAEYANSWPRDCIGVWFGGVLCEQICSCSTIAWLAEPVSKFHNGLNSLLRHWLKRVGDWSVIVESCWSCSDGRWGGVLFGVICLISIVAWSSVMPLFCSWFAVRVIWWSTGKSERGFRGWSGVLTFASDGGLFWARILILEIWRSRSFTGRSFFLGS